MRAALYGFAPLAVGAAAALRSLLPRYAAQSAAAAALALGSKGEGGGLFETLDEQRRAATLWLEAADGAPEVLDALRLLGLRIMMDVVRDAVGVAYGSAVAAQQARPDLLRDAEAASGERVMRTLAVRGLRERLPPEVVSDIIARHANADAPSWQMGIGPIMRAPRSTAIEAADARAVARAAARRGI